jgi:hypothetical protein
MGGRAGIGKVGSKRRDDFSSAVLKQIAGEVGHRCSNPGCGAPTSGPSKTRGISNVGTGSHITAAAPNGPRYNPALTSQERGSSANAIWLCGRCGRLVDNDTSRYSEHDLLDWKAQAIARAARALETGKLVPSGPSKAVKRHDISIFEKSNTLMSEEHLVEFLRWVLSDYSYRNVSDDEKEVSWMKFFEMEGNQYIIPALRDSVRNVRERWRDFEVFVIEHFFLVGSTEKLALRPEWNIDRGGHEEGGQYLKLAMKLMDVGSAVRNAYIAYRRTVKEHLFM